MAEVLTVRKVLLVAVLVVVAAGVGFARNSNSGFGPEGLEGLEKHKGGLFKTTLVRPNADFSQYDKLSPKRVLLQFRGPGQAQDESTAGSMVRKKSKAATVPEGEDLETFRRVVSDAFAAEMGSCEIFDLVSEAGPKTLLVRVMVADIVTDVAEKSSKQKPFSAQGTIVIDVIDAETGIIQARFSESSKSKKIKDPVEIPEAGEQWINIWSWAGKAAAKLRQELVRMHGQG
jgi:hypothetical protein